MAHVEMDLTELNAWTDVLLGAPERATKGARGVISKGALNIKNDARRLAPRGPHTPYYASSINYDLHPETVGIMAEIGPEEGRRQWGLGSLLEYGSQHNPPHPHLEPALDNEEPRFIAACEALAAEAVERG